MATKNKDDKKEVLKDVKEKSIKKKDNKNKQGIYTDLKGNIIKKTDNTKKQRISIKEHIKKNKKTYTIIAVSCIFVLVLLLIAFLINNYLIHKKYKPYKDKMEAYGFSILYDNELANSTQKVTKSELIRIILAALYNTTDVEEIGIASQGEFENDGWIATAVMYGIIEEESITKDNYNEKATYKDALIMLLNARSKVLDIQLKSSKEADFKNIQSYSQAERQYINDAVESELIENSNKNIRLDKKLIKGQLNELIVKLVQKYNTIVPEGETIVLKEKSLPKNASIYPYILYSVDKEVYEYKCENEKADDYKTPVETFKYKRDYYEQMQYRTEQYYNTILNINYETIDLNKFKEKAEEFLRYDYGDEFFDNYVNYVKENKIVIEGNAKVQLPIFYLDGINFRARVKLTFSIKAGNTDKNLLLGDMSRTKEVKYNKKDYTLYIDTVMGPTILSNGLWLDINPVIDLIVSDNKSNNLNEI